MRTHVHTYRTPTYTRQQGFTLIETIAYVSLLALIFFVIVNTLMSMSQSGRHMSVAQAIQRSAITSLDRMSRDIRNAEYINTGESVLGGVHPGVLVVEWFDEDGNVVSREYSIDGGVLHVTEDGVDTGPLTLSDTEVTDLTFEMIDTGRSEAVKIEMTIEAGEGSRARSRTFNNTVVLRNSY